MPQIQLGLTVALGYKQQRTAPAVIVLTMVALDGNHQTREGACVRENVSDAGSMRSP